MSENRPSISKGELIKERIEIFEAVAKKEGYEIVHASSPMIMIRKKEGEEEVVMNIFCDTFVVTTVLHHPKKGMTKLQREGCNMTLIKKIIKSPRLHTPSNISSKYIR